MLLQIVTTIFNYEMTAVTQLEYFLDTLLPNSVDKFQSKKWLVQNNRICLTFRFLTAFIV